MHFFRGRLESLLGNLFLAHPTNVPRLGVGLTSLSILGSPWVPFGTNILLPNPHSLFFEPDMQNASHLHFKTT